jgi:hypothetical protein
MNNKCLNMLSKRLEHMIFLGTEYTVKNQIYVRVYPKRLEHLQYIPRTRTLYDLPCNREFMSKYIFQKAGLLSNFIFHPTECKCSSRHPW